jgi:hypothetical protein
MSSVEMTSWDNRRSKFPGASGAAAPADDEHLFSDQPTSGFHVSGDAGREDYYDEVTPDGDGIAHDHPGVGRSAPRTGRFQYDRDDADFDEPVYESSWSGFLRATMFCLSMALIGSGASVIWHYYAPDFDLPASTRDVAKLNDSIGQLGQEQRKLTQTINGLQLLQDALQKAITARDQDLQRLTAEVRAVRTDLDALRGTAAASPAHPPLAQAPKRPSSPPAAKKKVERASVKPAAEREPIGLSPESQ